MIKENLKQVLSIIEEAKKDSPYHQDVTLVAVSKTHPAEDIQEAYDAGIRDFGENKVQELMNKIDVLPQDIRWHLIGHLQRNKVKYIIGRTYLIHSVDSLRLAEEIEKESAKHQVVTHILVQVNVSKEESKSGIETEQAIDLIRAISEMKHVQVEGLMTIAPEDENPENVRCYFRMLKKLSLDIDALNIDNIFMNFLSMGMSGDFVVAINEGSNLVRIGTKIFGARDYSNM
ncbi:MAG: YggS family pyridoxal phosphate-dependent enzyme [Lachnospiraceae bacterium]|nr:YggS family pyridoxal phosphate-dependent enzyme [Lachnospiraceae bacterium]MBR6357162.1 YggS family pyridoxal phosphate-dependent enzyme [Lachnospiraceae bacterium]MBR7075343.1 YggS family pyridoxal phosphate-dependent enzyme [Lachnospiraceae bacterium]